MERQRFFITNDDGIYARGLRSLIEVASNYGDITVIAPERGMSGKSHAITMEVPLMLREVRQTKGVRVYACEGTPVDCTKLAMDYVMKDNPPTMILSGINHGANSNTSVIYSGTMGAATEGSLYKVPSIGFSLLSHDPHADFTAAKAVAKRIIEDVIEQNDKNNLCLNVNIPYVPLDEIKGIIVCRQALGNWIEKFERRVTPNNKDYFWLTGGFQNHEIDATDTDEWALKHNYVAIVPVKTDMTDHEQLRKMEKWNFTL